MSCNQTKASSTREGKNKVIEVGTGTLLSFLVSGTIEI